MGHPEIALKMLIGNKQLTGLFKKKIIPWKGKESASYFHILGPSITFLKKIWGMNE